MTCVLQTCTELSCRGLVYIVVSLTCARPPPEILCQFSLQLNHKALFSLTTWMRNIRPCLGMEFKTRGRNRGYPLCLKYTFFNYLLMSWLIKEKIRLLNLGQKRWLINKSVGSNQWNNNGIVAKGSDYIQKYDKLQNQWQMSLKGKGIENAF